MTPRPAGIAASLATALLAMALPAQGGPIVQITPLSGGPILARGIEAEADGILRVTLADGTASEVELDQVETISVGGEAPLPTAGPGHVWLRSGVDLGARLAEGAGKSVRLELGLGEPASFRLLHLRALRLEAAEAAGDYDGFQRALAEPDATDDLLFAWNRRTGKLSRLSVRLLGIDEDVLRVDYRGERTVPLDQVHGVVFGQDNGFPPPRPAPPSVTLRAGDGTVLRGLLASWDDQDLRLRLAEGPVVTVPMAAVHTMDVRSSRVLRLSWVPPDDVLQVSALDRVHPWLVDRAPGGPGLELGGRRLGRGLCLFPRTRLTWQLEPHAFEVFETTIGIDARSTGPADAVFRVLLDGELAFEREHVGPGSAEDLRIPLGNSVTLSIEVDFGDGLDLGDHCVFADPRLLRT